MEIQVQSFGNKHTSALDSMLISELHRIKEANHVCIPVVRDKQDAGQTHDQLQGPPGGQEVSQDRKDDHASGVESPTHHGHKFPVV